MTSNNEFDHCKHAYDVRDYYNDCQCNVFDHCKYAHVIVNTLVRTHMTSAIMYSIIGRTGVTSMIVIITCNKLIMHVIVVSAHDVRDYNESIKSDCNYVQYCKRHAP